MPWMETDAMSQRIRFVRLVIGEGVSIREASRRFGVSAKTGHKWLARFRASFEVACLADRSRRPHQSPEQIDSEVEQRIVALRKRHGWGGRKLQTLLAREGVMVSARTVDRVIRRQGLTRLRAVMGRAVRRFERAQPNELWQIDFKGQYWLEPRGALFPLSVLDDHSRYAVSLSSLRGTAGTPVWQALELSFDEYGLPDAVLIDHGTPWYSTSNQSGLTWLSVRLLKQDIRLLLSGVRHPQTQGKVERFHQTLDQTLRHWGRGDSFEALAAQLRRFRREYNELRPHEALSLKTPAECYQPSARRYVPHGRPWEYEEGEVRRLNPAGALRYRGVQYFVSEALAGEQVSCLDMGDQLVIQFHRMYVRQIDLVGRRTYPLLIAVDEPGFWPSPGPGEGQDPVD